MNYREPYRKSVVQIERLEAQANLKEYQKIPENEVPYGEDWKKEVIKFTREELAELLRAACLRRDELQIENDNMPKTITREVNCEPLREEIAHMSYIIDELKKENETLKENGSDLHE